MPLYVEVLMKDVIVSDLSKGREKSFLFLIVTDWADGEIFLRETHEFVPFFQVFSKLEIYFPFSVEESDVMVIWSLKSNVFCISTNRCIFCYR